MTTTEMPKAKDHCVVVARMNPRSVRAFERGTAPKVFWEDLGERRFASRAAALRYQAKMTRFRPGRARIEAKYERR